MRFSSRHDRPQPSDLDLFRKINRVAQHFRTILLTGETGTGKELAAKALHRLGPAIQSIYNRQLFSWAESLLETELFGCVKGAFTAPSRIERECSNLRMAEHFCSTRLAICRFRANRSFCVCCKTRNSARRFSIVHKVDVRVIAATSRDLHVMVAKTNFARICTTGSR